MNEVAAIFPGDVIYGRIHDILTDGIAAQDPFVLIYNADPI